MNNLIDESSVDLWAEQEFGDAELGDVRRVKRLIMTASGKAKDTGAAMSLCLNKNDSQSICRLFDRPEVTCDSVINCHKIRTVERCKEYEKIYVTQDTSFLDFSGHKALDGLGRLCHEKTGKGLVMHSALAVTPDGKPLGVLDAKIWARPDDPREKTEQEKRKRIKSLRSKAIEEKESFKWLDCSNNVAQLLGDLSCNVILVSDRESDIFEYFAQERPKNFDFLVRVKFNRCAKKDEESDNEADEKLKLFDLMEKSDSIGKYTLDIPTRKGIKAHKAKIVLKSGSITLEPHKYLKKQGYSDRITLNWVYARETNSNKKPKDLIEWKLLTTLPVKTFDEAISCVRGYSKRWLIEEYHRVLKSGCKIEGLQFETLDRMYPAMGVCFVVAWRVLFLSKYARENPDDDATCVCSELEKTVLAGWLKINKFKDWKVETVEDFVRGVGILGGNPGRRTGGRPGPKTLWIGTNQLDCIVQGYLLAQQMQQLSGV
jgi:hypothetical protein